MPEEWNALEAVIEPPRPESPSFIAHKLLVAKDPTQLLVLQAVAKGPKRFKELKEATGQPDGQINRALDILHDEGVLVERLHARAAPAYKTHELGTKGILVVTMMQAFRDTELAIEVKQVSKVKPTAAMEYAVARGAGKTRAFAFRGMHAKKAARASTRFKVAKGKVSRKTPVRSSKARTHIKV